MPQAEAQGNLLAAGVPAVDLQGAVLQLQSRQVTDQRLSIEHDKVEKALAHLAGGNHFRVGLAGRGGVERQGVRAVRAELELAHAGGVGHLDEDHAPALFGQLERGRAGHDLQPGRILLASNADTDEAVPVQDRLDGGDAPRGIAVLGRVLKLLLVGVRQRSANQVQGVHEAPDLGGEGLKLDLLHAGQLGGRGRDGGQREQDGGHQNAGRGHHRLLRRRGFSSGVEVFVR